MIKVKLTTSFPAWPILRQTPKWRGEWNDYKFYVDDDTVTDCDYWVVYDGLLKPETVTCPKDNIIFIASEPPDIKTYASQFLHQFSLVISCNKAIKHPNNHLMQQSLPWMLGVKQKQGQYETLYDYDKLISYQNSKVVKNKLLSVVVSNKKLTQGHRQRLVFVEKLIKELGDTVDIFGRGFNEIADKWDAIAPYKYHLVMENSFVDDYFTEKLTDTYLGRAYPIYWGCPNLEKYFPEESFSRINMTEFLKVAKIINSNIYENSKNYIEISRNMTLYKYNLFSMLTNRLKKINTQTKKSKNTIFPESFRKVVRIKYIAKKFIIDNAK
ncbi:glycosyltransferase family 10 domain-containing protein [Methylomonas sp. MgM2]